jgi:hypothetical protein
MFMQVQVYYTLHPTLTLALFYLPTKLRVSSSAHAQPGIVQKLDVQHLV